MSILQKGDKVGIIAPSSGLGDNKEDVLRKIFSQIGLKVVLAKNIKTKYRYMAGSDGIRADAFNKMVDNDEIKALFCLRGGAGASRMIDKIDYKQLHDNHKIIIGLSDATALQNAALTMAKNPCLSGFLPIYDSKEGVVNAFMLKELKSALFDDEHNIKSGSCCVKGECEGEIVGGCLSVFNLLCGTKYFPNLKGKILLLEEIGEKTYKIDLWLNQLKQQHGFNEIKGIILGNFKNCKIKDADDGSIDDCINDFVRDLSVPVIKDFAYGHITKRHIVPLGIKVKMKSQKDGCSLYWKS